MHASVRVSVYTHTHTHIHYRPVHKHMNHQHFDDPMVMIMLKAHFLVRVPTTEMTVVQLSTSKQIPLDTHKHPQLFTNTHISLTFMALLY